MQVELHLGSPKIQVSMRTYDPELDDIRSILSDVCDFAHEHGRFVVSGFGQDPWPR